MEYPRYEDIEGDVELAQGDIIVNCHVILPNSEHYKSIKDDMRNAPLAEVIQTNGIVLSQSCDIINDKIQSIIICPIISLRELIKCDSYFKQKEARESLRQGKEPAYHLLHSVVLESFPEDYYVVVFRHIFSIPKDFVKEAVKEKIRKRLLPPYREHLSQSFARYFMRVGLPSDISRDAIKYYDQPKCK